MTTQNVPAIKNSIAPSIHEMQVYQTLAKNACQSSLYKGKTEAQIVMIMLAARELDIPPMMALNGGINCINDKLELSARLICKLVREQGHSISVKKLDKTGCWLVGKRKDGDVMEVSFTSEDAAAAGLINRPVWKAYLEDMLYSRALSRLGRRLFADIIAGSYVEGEISGDIPVEVMDKMEAKKDFDPSSFYASFEDAELVKQAVKFFSTQSGKTENEVILAAQEFPERFKESLLTYQASLVK